MTPRKPGSLAWKWRLYRKATRDQTVALAGVDVHWTVRLNGGGMQFGQDFVRVVDELGPVGRLAEWCAGPGFIGFALYGRGLCESVDLLDINRAATRAQRRTFRANPRVKGRAYRSDCFDSVGDARWDLIVANPPHTPRTVVGLEWATPLCFVDPDWRIHEKFYAQARAHLRPGGRIVLQENPAYSTVSDFEAMIAAGGLRVVSVEVAPTAIPMYYIVVQA